MAKQPKQSRSLAPIGNYPVGYCKPPTEHQFKKGQPSANKNGRPKGSRNSAKANPLPIVDIPILEMSLEEAARPIQVREGDKVIKIPAYQAGIRTTMRNAAKGSNPAMRNAHMITVHAERVLRERLEEKVVAWAEYKRSATEHLAYCKAHGIPFDWEIHPDDVEFDGHTGEIYIRGPLNQEERDAVNTIAGHLDFMIEVAEETGQEIKANPKLQKARKRLGLQLEVIRRLNACLLPRLQREVDADIRALAIMPESFGEEEDPD